MFSVRSQSDSKMFFGCCLISIITPRIAIFLVIVEVFSNPNVAKRMLQHVEFS